MSQNSFEPYGAEDLQVVRNQLEQMQIASGGNLAWDTEDAADNKYLYVPGRILVDAGQPEADFLAVLGSRPEFAVRGEARDAVRSTDTIVSYELPSFTGDRARDVSVAVRIFDQMLGTGVVTPEHYIHVAADGAGRACPATEPAETGVRSPWPPTRDSSLGDGVKVSVVDTGWLAGNEDPPVNELGPLDPLIDLQEYDGHGVFAEAIIKCQAPSATTSRVKFTMAGGVVPELDLARALGDAIDEVGDSPHVINMSAGCHTYNDQPLKAFEDLWTSKLSGKPNAILVAAAGNDSSPLPFYPAASSWAIGVGSLDRDDTISTFSNYLESANVFVLGRNHINLFPHGRYECKWTPEVDDVREFRTRWARWSGTSFSSPLLAGRIAAYLTEPRQPGDPATVPELARQLIVNLASWNHLDVYGDYRFIKLADFL